MLLPTHYADLLARLSSKTLCVFLAVSAISPAAVLGSQNDCELQSHSTGCSLEADSVPDGCAMESFAAECCFGESCGEPLFGSITPLTSPSLFNTCDDARKSIADSGITFNVNVAQFYMGVVSGGVDQSGRYSGHGDYVANIDGDKAFGAKGMFIKLRAEHRFGESMSGTTGGFFPPNVAASLPVAESDDLYLTNVLVTQMFSETFGVFAGKLDTLDGDQNAFASGRGISQFSNVAFVATPIGLRTTPYSTLGAGFVILQDLEPVFTFSALNATDTAGTVGLDELFNEGIVLVPELRIPTTFFGLPGHQLFGGTWSSRNYVSLNQDPRIVLPNVAIARQSDSWSLYYNFDQFLFVDQNDPKRGWGLFGRAGIADPDTNPIAWFLSAGVGGNSMIPGRHQDTFGAGFYYSGTSSQLAPILSAALGGIGDGYGTELFYNIAVTECFNLTADAQFLTPARKSVDSSVLMGLRGVISF
ncbi:MAG: carbohydrate porin [Planctomycetaceae bacterium]|nr:carbohydrate porin [Planctomycetaceae bacterium]